MKVFRPSSFIPAGAAVVGLLALAVYAFRGILTTTDRLPGIDASIFHAWETYTRDAFAAGRWPHWNPYYWTGVPHFADSLTAAIYLPAILLRWLPVPAFLSWMVVLHLAFGGAGTLLLARVLKLGWPAAVAAGMAVTLGGAAGSWVYLGHINIIYGAVWLPWAVALAVLSARRTSLLPHPALPIVLAVQFTGGYTQGAVYIVGAVALYYAFSAAWPEHPVAGSSSARLRPLWQLVVLGAITFGLTAVLVVPLVRLSFEMGRTLGLPYERAAAGGWSPADLSTFYFPYFGTSGAATYRELSHRVAYVGLLLAWAAPFAWFDRPRRREVVFLAVMTLTAVAFALGSHLPVYRLHYLLFPGLRIPGRMLFLVTLGMSVIGAIGLERLISLVRARNIRSLLSGAAWSVLCVMAASAVVYRGMPIGGPPPMHAWPWIPVLTAGALAATLLLAVRWPRAAMAPALCVLAVDLTAFASPGVNTAPVTTSASVEQLLGPSDGGRVITFCDRRVSSTELLLAERPGIEGPIGVTLRDYDAWRHVLGAADWPSDTLGHLRIRRDLMNLAGISTVVSCEPIEAPSLTLITSHESLYVYRNDLAWPRATWACGSQQLPRDQVARRLRDARYDANRSLTTERVINVRWAPGIDDTRRRELEDRYQLRESVSHEDRTWRYPLGDSSSGNLAALIHDPAVEDTAGIDRATAKLAEETASAEERTDVLIGTGRCDVRARVSMITADQPDGRVAAAVDAPADGLLFFSEPFYSERRAYVDGASVEATRAALGFTAVRVPAGRHTVELRMVPSSFYAGLALTIATLVIWIAASAWRR